MKLRRLASALVAVTMATMMFSIMGCDRKNKLRDTNVVIQKDDPWYLATTIKLQEKIDTEGVLLHPVDTTVLMGDMLFVSLAGSMLYSDGMYNNAQEFALMDLEGNVIQSYLLAEGDKYGYVGVLGGTYKDDHMDILWSDSNGKLQKMEWDIPNNEMGEPEELDFGLGSYSVVTYHEQIEDKIYLNVLNAMTGALSILVVEDCKVIDSVDLNGEGLSDIMVQSVSEVEGKIVFDCYDTVSDNGYFTSNGTKIIYDPSSGEVTTEKTGVLRKYQYTIGYDGRSYCAKTDGIYADDELYISYQDCDVNMKNIANMSILLADEETLIIRGVKIDLQSYTSESILIKLEKQSENPNAGKTVLNALSPFELSSVQTEGILKYNREDHDFFVKCQVRDMCEIDMTSDAEVEKFNRDLALELISDTSPDIVFNAQYLSDTMTDSYFLDLKDEIKPDPDKYYTNISDLSMVGGKLYMLPLTFSLSGIITDRSNLREDQNGFTYDEYKEFVSGPCNGIDPVAVNFAGDEYYSTLLTSMGNYWVEDGKANFDTPEFREMLEFVKGNVQIKESGDEKGSYVVILEEGGELVSTGPSPAVYVDTSVYSLYSLQARKFVDPVFCGLPSTMGKGPVVSLDSTVSITANTGAKEACIDFINTLLDTEVMLNTESFTLNKEAQEMLVSAQYQKDLDAYKDSLMEFRSQVSTNPNKYKPDEKTQQQLLSIIENAGSISFMDSAVYSIVYDESMEYLAGHKDMDTVIETINNRVQTYLNEK